MNTGPSMTPAENPGTQLPRWAWASVVVVTVGTALRAAGALDDFWLDEIWSWRIARGLESAAGVLTSDAARSDNNHPLNTLLMYWMGDRAYWPVYRIPSMVAGSASVVLGAWVAAVVGRRGDEKVGGRGGVAGLFAAVLLGLSYPMVVYSSEARGYGLVVFFALAAFAGLMRFLDTRSWAAGGVFVVATVLGFLSHLTFAHFFLGAAAWSAIVLVPRRRVADLLWLHLIPAAFVGFLLAVFVRHVTVGGAPDTSTWDVVASTLALAGGGSGSRGLTAVVAVTVATILVGSLAVVWQTRRDLFVFYITCIVVSPALFVVAQRVSMRGQETLFPRYFLVPIAFAYLLVATAAAAVWDRRAWRTVVSALLALFAVASLWQVAAFLRGGRGHYLDAVTYMAERTPGEVVTVAGDNEFRTGMLLSFYARYVPAGKRLEMVPLPPQGGPEWLIINSPEAGADALMVKVVAGTPYRFEREFTYYGLSGWSWYLYRHQTGP